MCVAKEYRWENNALQDLRLFQFLFTAWKNKILLGNVNSSDLFYAFNKNHPSSDDLATS